MSPPPPSLASASLNDLWAMTGLRSKLLLGFGGLLAVLFTVSILANLVLSRYSSASQRMLREDLVSVQAAQEMQDALVGIEGEVELWLKGPQGNAPPKVDRYVRQFDQGLKTQQAAATLPREPELTEKISDFWAQYHAGLKRLLDPDLPADQRRSIYESSLDPVSYNIRAGAREISRLNIESIRDVEGRAASVARAARVAMYALTACGAGVALLFALLLGRMILQPVRSLTRSVQEVQQGNLDLTVPIRSRDELGQLAVAFNAMAAQLREFRRIDHEKLIRTQRTTQQAIDSLPDGVAVINPDGGIELVNDTARRLFDLRPGIHVGQVTALPDGRLADLHQRATRDGRLPEVGGYAAAIRVRDGGQDRYFLPRAVPILDEGHRAIGLTVVLADVTDFRRLDEIKNGLLSLVSHELKTPLTSLRMILPLLVEGKVGGVNPKQRELLVAAREDSDRLHQIVENLLDMGRLESGKGLMDVQPIDAAELIEESIEPRRAAFVAKGVQLVLETGCDSAFSAGAASGPTAGPDESKLESLTSASSVDPHHKENLVLADATRIRHVFANLLANALRYTPAGGEVRVALRDAQDRIEFSVCDNGAGIPRQHLHRVFEKFFRVPGQAGDTGSGLGLAIVKDVIEAHGGHVGVESVEGQGATFRFTLRKAGQREQAVRPGSQQAARSALVSQGSPQELVDKNGGLTQLELPASVAERVAHVS